MATVRRELLIDYLQGTVGPATVHEVMVILEDVFLAVESGTLPRARLELYHDSADSAELRVLRSELDRLHAFEAMQDASDLRVRGVIMADSETLSHHPDFKGGDPYEGTIIEMARGTDSGDPALRTVIRDCVGEAMFGAVMNSQRAMEESMAIFRNMHAVIHAYLVFALEGQGQKMIRLARLLHILPTAVPFARTGDGEVVVHSGDAIYGEIAETVRDMPVPMEVEAPEVLRTEPPQPDDFDVDVMPVVTGTPVESADLNKIGEMLAEAVIKFQDEIAAAKQPPPLPADFD